MTPQQVSGIDQRKDRSQTGWWFRWIDDAKRDLRHAARLLWSDPLFTSTAALSLAIAIGANTTVFTLADALLFQAAPGLVAPDRLVDIGGSRTPGRFGPSSYLNYLDIRQRTTTLEGVYAYSRFPQPVTLGGLGTDAGTVSVFASFVTVNYFTVLGAVPAAGRLLSAADSEAAGASPLVVLSHRCWIRRFNGDPGVVGRSVTINGAPFTVIGVAAEAFRGTGLRVLDLWVAMNMVTTVTPPQAGEVLTNRAADRFLVGGRLKRVTSLAQAAAEMDAIGKSLERDFPEQNRNLRLQLLASSPTPGGRGPAVALLALLLVIVAFVLIVACANVAGVLLARADARRKEMALRLAIGAGRSRLIRQLLTESLLLFVLGGTAGVVLAGALTSALGAEMPALPFPIDLSLALNTRVMAFTSGISLVAAVLCGLAPALQASTADVLSALNNEPRFVVGRLRLRYAFIVGQVTFSIVLVIVAGLFGRALQRAATIDLGFNPHGVEIAAVDLSQAGYTVTTGAVFTQQMVDRLRALPDVQRVAVASGAPGGIQVRRETLDVPAERGVDAAAERGFVVDWTIVSPGYFATLGTPLPAGRDFSPADREGAEPVVIVSEAAAGQFWPGQDPLGKYVLLTNPVPGAKAARQPLLVVGVARDMQVTTLVDGVGRASVYVPLAQHFQTSLTILARTTNGQRIADEIRILLRSMDPNVAVLASQTLDESIALGFTPQRIAAAVSGALGLVGLLLAGIGLYGVTAYVVTRRTREIGIRIALGARRGDLVTMILREGLSLTLIGSVIGLALAALISQVLRGFLFGVPPIDPVTFAGTTLLFVAIAVAACYRPLRRGMCINPTQALRYE